MYTKGASSRCKGSALVTWPTGRNLPSDGEGLIRLDDLELRDDIQTAVAGLWEKVSTENLEELSDIAVFRREFNNLFGFDVDGVDYAQPTETDVAL